MRHSRLIAERRKEGHRCSEVFAGLLCQSFVEGVLTQMEMSQNKIGIQINHSFQRRSTVIQKSLLSKDDGSQIVKFGVEPVFKDGTVNQLQRPCEFAGIR